MTCTSQGLPIYFPIRAPLWYACCSTLCFCSWSLKEMMQVLFSLPDKAILYAESEHLFAAISSGSIGRILIEKSFLNFFVTHWPWFITWTVSLSALCLLCQLLAEEVPQPSVRLVQAGFPQQSNAPVFTVIAVWILRLQALCLLQEVLWPQLPRLVMPSVWSVCLQVQLQLTLVYLLATSLQSRAWCMPDINSIIMCKAGYWKIKVLTSLSFQTHFITKFNFFIPFICCIKILFF